MKLSVIVPAFKLAPFIYECLLSLVTQHTNFDFEVVVCDDASPDNTFEVINYLQSAFPHLVVLRNEVNLGLIGTMRRLLETARGQYIAYVDGDDIALPGKLQQQVDYLEQHPGCSMVYHESDMFDSATGQHLKWYSKDYYNYQYIPQQADITHLIRYTVFLQASSVMFRRHASLIQALQHDCKIICDFPWHMMNIGLLGGTIDRLDAVLGRYRIHNNSFGAQTQQNHQRRLNVTEELVSACRLGQQFGVAEDVIEYGVNHIYFSAALYFLRLNETELFRQMIELSASRQLYFDQRHQSVFEHRDQPDVVKQQLGWVV
ncbi:glycosyltransferase [Rheinheimera sediminis]|uniref:glycosyltransferase family 2 protein n=1 Tax=Rheinheimera sp. YQF-1 TaxID=2499626 RepID=UPI000FDA39A4|nr:glycosyltransferase [Rheinheimera sp. YQF-1]RVT46986.1 glycosyltransferase [Rheinheimera sp. YQF-1]